MNWRYNPPEDEDKNEDLTAWYAEQGLPRYPDDLPFPRRLSYGPQTSEEASRFLDADYPLPGTFQPTSLRQQEELPAWITSLQEGEIYPGARLSEDELTDRRALVSILANQNYVADHIAKKLLDQDRRTGYSPIFEFQYVVLNFKQWSEIVFFELNGVTHILHWNDDTGWNIDKQPILSRTEEAMNDFILFDLVANCLHASGQNYPVIKIKRRFPGDPSQLLNTIPRGAPTKEITTRFGVMRRNPDDSQELQILEADYFSQPGHIRRDDLKSINRLRQKLGMPEVDSNLQVFLPEPTLAAPQTLVAKPKIDKHVEARDLYRNFLEKEAFLLAHRDYCSKILAATTANSGQTPVMPLAIMGTGGGPLLCDTCHKQIPLEGGKYQGVGARDAWDRNTSRRTNWCSFVSGGVTFMQESNKTLRVYHGYENGCMAKDPNNKTEAKGKVVPWDARQKLNDFLLEEQKIMDDAERKLLVNSIVKSTFGYDPGVGVNGPG